MSYPQSGLPGDYPPQSQPEQAPVWTPQPMMAPATSSPMPAQHVKFFDLGTAGAALLVVVFMFLPYYTMSDPHDSDDYASFFGWNGPVSVVAALFIVLAGLVALGLAADVIAAAKRSSLRIGMIVGLGAGWALVLISLAGSVKGMLAKFGLSRYTNSLDFGHGVGFWLTLAFATIGFGLAIWVIIKTRPANPHTANMAMPGMAPGTTPTTWPAAQQPMPQPPTVGQQPPTPPSA